MSSTPLELVARIAEMYSAGMSQSKISAILGVAQSHVCNLMKRYGIEARSSALGGVRHGLCDRTSPEYNAWRSMRHRCLNKDGRQFHLYGGRGIAICAEWDAFPRFLADMGDRPSPGHSLDRINVNGDYCPENCRWATKREQANNKRDTHFVDYQGRKLPLSIACELSGIKHNTAIVRILRGRDYLTGARL